MEIYIVGSATHYANFIQDADLTPYLEKADIVLFTGGEDVDPSFYGCVKHPKTYSNPERDRQEIEIFKQIKPNQLVVSVCRGSQLMCVVNGGLLVQHCTGHAIGSTHSITNGSEMYEITSTHHQMQYPYDLPDADYEVLFTSTENLSYCYCGDGIDDNIIISKGEPEIVLYHKEGLPKCLAIQGHPEMIPHSPVAKMLNNLIKELVDGNK